VNRINWVYADPGEPLWLMLGHGREAWWWIAGSYVDGKQRVRRFSVDKYGDREARRLAVAQRDEWESYAGRM
jgi:hypothetical protein